MAFCHLQLILHSWVFLAHLACLKQVQMALYVIQYYKGLLLQSQPLDHICRIKVGAFCRLTLVSPFY